ncbi:MAG: hypothetical protein ACPGWR_09660 [Ardenticatenaceae bacterium]
MENTHSDQFIGLNASTGNPENNLYKLENKTIVTFLMGVYVPVLLMLGVLVFASIQFDIPISIFTRDPAAVAHVPLYAGFISNVGVLFWCATAAVSFFTVLVLVNTDHDGKPLLFLLGISFLTGLLMLDDLFLFHEKIYPRFLHLPEKAAFVGYGIFLLACLIQFRAVVLSSNYVVLFVSFLLMGLSLAVDTLPEDWSSFHHLFEDGFKLLGIVTWFVYFSSLSAKQIESALRPADSPTVGGDPQQEEPTALEHSLLAKSVSS